MDNDTEIMSNHRVKLLSHLQEGFIEEYVYRLGELPEVGVEAVMCNIPVEEDDGKGGKCRANRACMNGMAP